MVMQKIRRRRKGCIANLIVNFFSALITNYEDMADIMENNHN